MYALLPVFVASFLGSLHCVGMCGGFVALASSNNTSLISSTILYHFGRLLTYITLGILVGSIARQIDQTSAYFGVIQLAPYLASFILIIFGVRQLLFSKGLSAASSPGLLFNLYATLKRHLIKFDPSSRAYPFLLGCSTTFLPCGWLYSFLTAAATTAHPLKAVVVMTVFWLGTIPALSVSGVISRYLTLHIIRFAPKLAAVLLIIGGISAIYFHNLHANHTSQEHHSHTHH